MEWVITAINCLTGKREEISRPMSREEAEERLQRELENRKRQRYQSYRSLRVSRRLPIQLLLKFEDYD